MSDTMNGATGAALRNYLLAFADDEHLMGQQHTEWIGVAPFLEEDLAFSSIGQDELGHAVMLYELVCELDGIEITDATVDALAYRGADRYRSAALVEYHTTDWAEALVRHWIYDTVEAMRWELVATSSVDALAAIGQRAEREESFHRLHADAMLDPLVQNPDARPRLLAALDALLPLAPSLIEAVAGEAELLAAGVTSGPMTGLAPKIKAAIAARFDIAEPDLYVQDGANRTTRSADFQPLMTRMREVIDLDPAAVW